MHWRKLYSIVFLPLWPINVFFPVVSVLLKKVEDEKNLGKKWNCISYDCIINFSDVPKVESWILYVYLAAYYSTSLWIDNYTLL